MAHIVEHLPLRQLEACYRASQDATEARHYQAIWLLARGRTVLEVAEVLAFVPRWVEQLARRYNVSGPEARGERRAGGGGGGPGGGRGAGLCAALGGAAGAALQRLRAGGAGRPAAAERP